MQKFKSIFKKEKPVIGVIHVKALPGVPKQGKPLDIDPRRSRRRHPDLRSDVDRLPGAVEGLYRTASVASIYRRTISDLFSI